LLHALSQLDPPVEVIHLTDTSHFLEHDQTQEREQTLCMQKTLGNLRSQVPSTRRTSDKLLRQIS
jgi:hypothetical protein